MVDPKTDNDSVKAQAKMDFADLRYLAFEGGGAKGAVYKGAILALEKLFEKRWKSEECLRIEDGEIAGPGPADKLLAADEFLTGGTSILDYYLPDKTLKIKGISGASAGAITAFALALGLTSDHIETILASFKFKEEFLRNHKLCQGKYRMVGMNEEGRAQLLVAEDHFKKLGEDQIRTYEVELFKGDPAIKNNFIKSLVRNQFVAVIFSIVFTGLRQQWPLISRWVGEVMAVLEKYNYLKKGSAWIRTNIIQEMFSLIFDNPVVVRWFTSRTPVPLNAALKVILKIPLLNRLPWGSKYRWKIIKGLVPADNIVGAVSNIIWDRGIYAGFEIRELFFKILMMAISVDTRLSRQLPERTELLKSIGLKKSDIKEFTVEFDRNFEIQVSKDARETLEKLKGLQNRLTFKELHEITKVNLTICVTNGTTAQPVYFSHYFTPDFPVMEAVGASMSFPVAFKPIYSEANVLLPTLDAGRPGFVEFSKHGRAHREDAIFPRDFIRPTVFKEFFSMREYNKHLGIVLAYVRSTSEIVMSVNGNLSFRSFLLYLRKIIEDEKFKPFPTIDHANKGTKTLDAREIKQLCYFYYNSAFKGLLFDGGATNNLPLSIFTFDTKKAVQDLEIKKSVLALKLDNSFPEEIRTAAFEILEKDPKTLEGLTGDNEQAHLKFAARVFKRFLFRRQRFRRRLKKQRTLTLPKPVWTKLSQELVAEYKRDLGGFTPWNRQMNVISQLAGALDFGMDQGQIDNIEDNKNIIPLYCYGLDVFDFDLRDLWPLVDLAVEESEKQVRDYFKGSK